MGVFSYRTPHAAYSCTAFRSQWSLSQASARKSATSSRGSIANDAPVASVARYLPLPAPSPSAAGRTQTHGQFASRTSASARSASRRLSEPAIGSSAYRISGDEPQSPRLETTMIFLGLPARMLAAVFSMMCVAARGGWPTHETTTSAPAHNLATSSLDVASPWTILRFLCVSVIFEGVRASAVTEWPRSKALVQKSVPTGPVEPRTAIFTIRSGRSMSATRRDRREPNSLSSAALRSSPRRGPSPTSLRRL